MTSRQPPTWRQLHPTDDPRLEAIRFQQYSLMPAWRKLELLDELNQFAYEVALAGLRQRNPEASEAELLEHLRCAAHGVSGRRDSASSSPSPGF